MDQHPRRSVPLPLPPPARGGGKELSTALLTANAAFFTLPFISFRPVTFALLIFAVIVALLSHDRAAPTKRVWLIVPLTALAGFPVVWAAGGIPHAVFPTTYDQLLRLTGGMPADVA